MNNEQSPGPLVVELLPPELHRNPLWPFGKARWKVPPWKAGTRLFLRRFSPRGHPVLQEFNATDAGREFDHHEGDGLVRVTTHTPGCELTCAALVRDAQHHAWDLFLSGSLQVANAQQFLEAGILDLMAPGAPMSRAMTEAWLGHRIGHFIPPAVERYSLEQLRDRAALPPEWWEARLAEWLRDCGLRLANVNLRWASAEAGEAESRRRVQEEFQRRHEAVAAERQGVLQEREANQQFEQRKAEMAAQHEQKRQQLQHDTTLSEMARQHELEKLARAVEQQQLELEEAYRKRQLELQGEREQARYAIEKAALRHEDELAQLREAAEERRWRNAEAHLRAQQNRATAARHDDLRLQAELAKLDHAQESQRLDLERQRAEAEAVARKTKAEADRAELEVQAARERPEETRPAAHNIKASEVQAEQRHTAALNHFDALGNKLDLLLGLYRPLLAKLVLGQTYEAGGWLERLQHGVSPEDLAALGFVTPQLFTSGLEKKAQAEGNIIQLKKLDLQRRDVTTRDILTKDIGTMPMEVLPENSPVAFEFTTRRAGYLTFINPGTTGRFWLHVPNVHVPSPRVEAGRTYRIPGPELLPEDKLRAAGLAFFESGPPGWEYLVVIVSDVPLVEDSLAGQSHFRCPMVLLHPEDMRAIQQKLDSWDSASWSAGVLSFRVVKP